MTKSPRRTALIALMMLSLGAVGCEMLAVTVDATRPPPGEPQLTAPATAVPPGVVPIEQARYGRSAQDAMTARITERIPGTCQSGADIDGERPRQDELSRYDAEVESRGRDAGSGEWVDDGRWLGDRESAFRAFGATSAIEDDAGGLWIEVMREGGGVEGLELDYAETPHGRQVWWTGDFVGAC